MRLLNLKDDGEFSLIEFIGDKIPRYAILSHTWGTDSEEVTFKDLMEGTGKSKAGYQKIRFCGKQAATDDLQYFWVDTCCIDKSSSSEAQHRESASGPVLDAARPAALQHIPTEKGKHDSAVAHQGLRCSLGRTGPRAGE